MSEKQVTKNNVEQNEKKMDDLRMNWIGLERISHLGNTFDGQVIYISKNDGNILVLNKTPDVSKIF